MSSMIAVKRPPPERFIHQNEPSSSSTKSPPPIAINRNMISTSTKTSPVELFTQADLENRLQGALRERDDQWLRHEKAQIHFLQSEGAHMLKGLHDEVDRLSHLLRDAKRRLDVEDDEAEESEKLRNLIQKKEDQIAVLEAQLLAKECSLKDIERKVNATVEKMNDTIKIQSDRIRQLSGELQDRTLTVTQLSSQLRQYRLREAMATAQHRRRASAQNVSGGSSPLVSPSSPHRIFPPQRSMQMCFVDDDLASASVSVTYPGNPAKMRPAVLDPSLGEIVPGIEKQKFPLRRKSASSSAGNVYKN
ncbi:unnamed protein product, partial [Mesorhabditis belari]|uniref:CCDC92/74 N-terminal domain-containing protein n=1 Tax=Mesorhabditis belari TaxID=2138241 RepID=A0AAF3E884_9BILA